MKLAVVYLKGKPSTGLEPGWSIVDIQGTISVFSEKPEDPSVYGVVVQSLLNVGHIKEGDTFVILNVFPNVVSVPQAEGEPNVT